MSDRERPVVIVTGASRGIGRAIALRISREGVIPVLVSRSAADLDAVSKQILEEHGVQAEIHALDLSSESGVKELFTSVFGKYGRLDGLVNNAGVMSQGLLGMTPTSEIDRTLAINLRAPLLLMQYAARMMRRSKRGSIVNMSSIMGTQGAPGMTVYAATKAGLIGATLAASKELAADGIRVNVVAPGFIDTDMTSSLTKTLHDDRVSQIGMRRAGTPEEVANLVWFLLSDASEYISGQVIGIDGQMST